MTAIASKAQTSRAQGLAEWMVILLVAIALIAGWGLKASAENAVERYSANGITLSYPAHWMPSRPSDGSLRFRDTQAGGVPATITVRPASACSAEAAAATVAAEAEGLILTHGSNLTAYSTLSTASAAFRGQPARRVSYAYVQDNANAFLQSLPVVMLGEDLVTYQQGQVYVISLRATQGEFAAAQGKFEALLGSIAFGSE